jgi:hypothetical protein
VHKTRTRNIPKLDPYAKFHEMQEVLTPEKSTQLELEEYINIFSVTQILNIVLILRAQSGRGRKLFTHLQLVPKSRICGSLHPLPYVFMV